MGHFLYLPAPCKLDATERLTSKLVLAVAQDFLKLTPPAPSEKLPHRELLNRLGRQLETLAERLDAFFAGLASTGAAVGFATKQVAYDRHFRVIRSDGNAADLIVASNVVAFCNFFKDMRQGCSLVALELYMLLATVQCFIAGFIPIGEN